MYVGNVGEFETCLNEAYYNSLSRYSRGIAAGVGNLRNGKRKSENVCGYQCSLGAPPQTAWKLTEIGRITVVMYDSDHFVDGEMQLTHNRDPSTKFGFWVGAFLKDKENDRKTEKY